MCGKEGYRGGVKEVDQACQLLHAVFYSCAVGAVCCMLQCHTQAQCSGPVLSTASHLHATSSDKYVQEHACGYELGLVGPLISPMRLAKGCTTNEVPITNSRSQVGKSYSYIHKFPRGAGGRGGRRGGGTRKSEIRCCSHAFEAATQPGFQQGILTGSFGGQEHV